MALAGSVLLCACAKEPEQPVVPSGSPMADTFRFQYAVYYLPVPSQDPSAVLRAKRRGAIPT